MDKKIQRFTEYLEGLLADAEKREFENQLQTDRELLAEFDEFKSVYSGLKNQFSEERDALLNTLQKATAEHKTAIDIQPGSKAKKRIKFWYYGMAASILLVIGLFVFNRSTLPQYEDFAPREELNITQRNSNNTNRKNAEANFNNQNYEEALLYLNTLLKEEPDNTELLYFKAVALVEMDNYYEAEKLLSEIQSGSSVYADKAAYRLALSKLKQKDYEAVRSSLEKIPENAEEYEAAQKLLKKLN